MLALDSSFKFELYLGPTDMRKSFDSLYVIVSSDLSGFLADDTVYIFVNRLHNKVKLLQWRVGGLESYCYLFFINLITVPLSSFKTYKPCVKFLTSICSLLFMLPIFT